MKTLSKRQAALGQLLDEVRAERPAIIDCQRLERSLLQRLEHESHASGQEPAATRRRYVKPLLAAAAGVVLGSAAFWERQGSVTEVDSTISSSPLVGQRVAASDGGNLQVGQRVVARSECFAANHAGLAEWSLAPQSSAEVKAREPALVIQLQAGKLFAKVVPSAKAESFVVEVGGVSVAVRGTEFSVERADGFAIVEVSAGKVAVGPLDKPATVLLTGPAYAKLVATGELAGKVLESRGGVKSIAAAARLALPRPADTSKTKSPPPPLPQEPTFEEVERGLALVEATLGNCLEQHTARRGSIQLSLETRVTFRVEADGRLSRYRFSPPLAPNVAECARKGFEAIRFAPTAVGAHIIRDLQIKR